MRFCSLASSSSGNSLFIEEEDTKVLVDAGLSGKRIKESLASIGVEIKELSAVLVTHEHGDHIKGVGVLSRKYDLPVYATEKTWGSMGEQIGKISEDNKFYIEKNKSLEFEGLKFECFSTSHDTVDPIGVTFCNKNSKGAIMTDTGKLTSSMLNNLLEADFLFCEANHDEGMVATGSYPWSLKKRVLGEKGHLSNKDLAEGLAKILSSNETELILGHLSEENNRPDLALDTVSSILEKNGLRIGKDVHIRTASKNNISCCHNVD